MYSLFIKHTTCVFSSRKRRTHAVCDFTILPYFLKSDRQQHPTPFILRQAQHGRVMLPHFSAVAANLIVSGDSPPRSRTRAAARPQPSAAYPPRTRTRPCTRATRASCRPWPSSDTPCSRSKRLSSPPCRGASRPPCRQPPHGLSV